AGPSPSRGGSDGHLQRAEDRRRFRVRATWRDIADLDLQRLASAELAAHQSPDDVEAVALRDALGKVGAVERDSIDDVDDPAQRQLRMCTVRRADARHGHAQDRDEWIRIPRPARRERREIAVQGAIDRRRGEREVEPRDAPAVVRPYGASENPESFAESVPALGRQLEPRRARMAAEPGEQVTAGLER